MVRDNFNDLHAFVKVAREGNFTRAAAQLGVSQSALSHTIRGLEARLGLRLLTRNTRGVSPTEAGERLLRTLAPRFEEIALELAALSELRDKPAGAVRITATEYAADSILWPKLEKLLLDYPDLKIEVNVDYGMTNIVAQRYDAGVRCGCQVEKDMIAVRISPDRRVAVVGSPSYFAKRSVPKTPEDLAAHNCIGLRLPTYDNILAWEFEKDGHAIKVQAQGKWISNISSSLRRAALAGVGLAYLPADMVEQYVAEGHLVSVLQDWCPLLPGYHLYYPNRLQSSSVLNLVIDALRLV